MIARVKNIYMELRCLHIADIFGKTGLQLVRTHLPELIKQNRADVVIANGENAFEGKGISENICEQLFDLGVQVITSGNHIWDRKKTLTSENPRIQEFLLRPHNYPSGNDGKGSVLYSLPNNYKVAVINLQGRTYMYSIDCPFRCADKEIERLHKETKIVIIDFHAEATAEKMAFAHYVDGRVSAVIGTHTHVPTADEQILPGGTAYITDIGMTGPHDGVIGMKKEIAIRRFLTQTNSRFEPSEGKPVLHGLFFTIDADTGKATHIERFRIENF